MYFVIILILSNLQGAQELNRILQNYFDRKKCEVVRIVETSF